MPTFVAIGASPGLLDVGRGGGAVDLVGPVVSGVVVTEIKPATGVSGSTVRVVALTDEPATVVVQYGVLSGAPYANATAPTVSGTSHTIDVPGLVGGTPYYLRVVATDAALNVTNGTEETITTRWSPAAWLTDQQFQMSAYLAKLGDAGAGIAALVDNAEVQDLRDWSGKGLTFVMTTAGAKPLYLASGAHGAPAYWLDGVDDNWVETTHVAGMELTGARCLYGAFRVPSGAARARLIGHVDTTTNTVRWSIDFEISGAISIFEDTKGSAQLSTDTSLRDDTNHAFAFNRDASGNEELWLDGTLHQTFTGMGNTAPTGQMRIGKTSSGAALQLPGYVMELGAVSKYLAGDEMDQLMIWLGA